MRAPTGTLKTVENWASWLGLWMVYWANNKPENKGRRPKVGGHQASALSSASILTAYYGHLRRPQDRIAVKPHAAPVLYALLYMMGKLSRREVENLREFGGLPAYPVQHHYPGIIDYSTSIEGVAPAATVEDAYEALVQNAQFGKSIDTRYDALVGDGEMTELQIGGTLYEAGRRQLSNVCWWIDINRQSLDRVMDDSPLGSTGRWIDALFQANGWNTIDLRWGRTARSAFAKRGGKALRQRLESLSDGHYQVLLMLEGPALRQALTGGRMHDDPSIARLLTTFASSSPVSSPPDLANLPDDDLRSIVHDMGGHDLELLIDAREQAAAADRPTAILCHTIKGRGMGAWIAHPENHGAVMSGEAMEQARRGLGIPDGDPFALPAEDSDVNRLLIGRARELFPAAASAAVAYRRDRVPSPGEIQTPLDGRRSTSAVFGHLNLGYLKSPIGKYMAFAAPDVGLTTHLGGIIAATGVFEPRPAPDLFEFLREKRQQPFGWRPSREGQFHSIAINEGLAAMLAYAFGRDKYEIEGKERLIPVVTIYDVFWKHAYTQLYYALYDHARFIAVGTPSGTSLSRESGTHQSIQTPAIFMGLPNIIYYEPAFAIDMKVLYQWALEQIVGESGESVYLRLTTQELEQPGLAETPDLREQIVRGGYWVRNHRGRNGYDPQRNVGHVFATGPLLAEAIRASDAMLAEQWFLNVCNVTSWERLKRDWEAFWTAPDPDGSYHLNELIPDDELNVPAVVVGDFTPPVADWLGHALGKSVPVLGPRQFSETGSVEAVRRFHRIDAEAIVETIRSYRDA